MHARDLADRTVRDDLAELLVERREAKDIAREHEALRLDLRLLDVLALLPRAANRLLEKDMIALLKRQNARLVVKTVGKRDDDGVGVDAGLERLLPVLPRRIGRVRREGGHGIGKARDLELPGVGLRVLRVGAAANPVPQDNRPDRTVVHQTSTFQPLQSPSRLSEMPVPVPLANSIFSPSQSKPVSYW